MHHVVMMMDDGVVVVVAGSSLLSDLKLAKSQESQLLVALSGSWPTNFHCCHHGGSKLETGGCLAAASSLAAGSA